MEKKKKKKFGIIVKANCVTCGCISIKKHNSCLTSTSINNAPLPFHLSPIHKLSANFYKLKENNIILNVQSHCTTRFWEMESHGRHLHAHEHYNSKKLSLHNIRIFDIINVIDFEIN